MKTTKIFYLLMVLFLFSNCGKDEDDNYGLQDYSFNAELITESISEETEKPKIV